MLGKLKGKESERQEILDIREALDAQQRNAAVHYNFGGKDYIPIAYKDSISANMTIRNLIDVVHFLNQLNRVATWLKWK